MDSVQPNVRASCPKDKLEFFFFLPEPWLQFAVFSSCHLFAVFCFLTPFPVSVFYFMFPVQWNLNVTNLYITNDFLCLSNSKYIKIISEEWRPNLWCMITVLRFDWEGTINFCNAEEKHFFFGKCILHFAKFQMINYTAVNILPPFLGILELNLPRS